MTVNRSASTIRTIFAGLTAIAVLSLSGPANAGTVPSADALAAPPTGEITLDVITVNGSGCPAGTASVRMLSDNTGFRINYASFIARDGGTALPTAFRQNCQTNVLIHVPQGFTYAVATAEYRGRASLRSTATALHRTNYYFQSSPDNAVSNHAFTGPFSGSWRTVDTAEIAELVYAPCGVDSVLNINTELRVNSPTGASWISLRASELNVDTIFHVDWKTC